MVIDLFLNSVSNCWWTETDDTYNYHGTVYSITYYDGWPIGTPAKFRTSLGDLNVRIFSLSKSNTTLLKTINAALRVTSLNRTIKLRHIHVVRIDNNPDLVGYFIDEYKGTVIT